MLMPGLSICEASKGHMSRILILTLLKLGTCLENPDWSLYWRNALREYKVIPDILHKDPPIALGAVYFIFVVNFGELLTPFQISERPTRMEWPTRNNNYYTLILTGIDVPTKENNTVSEWAHWVVVNIRGEEWKWGEELIDYQGDSHIYGPGLHRCVFVAYKQPLKRKLVFTEERVKNGTNDHLRAHFSTKQFVRKYGLGNPVAANFFTFESEYGVPKPTEDTILGLTHASKT